MKADFIPTPNLTINKSAEKALFRSSWSSQTQWF